MAFYTKPINPTKGQDNQVSLDKSQLALDPIVAADAYFSDSSNWKYVVINYKSTEGSQIEKVTFNVIGPNTTVNSTFKVSDKARDTFEVQSLVIYDFDGGFLKLNRDDLTVSEFDVDFSSGGAVNFLTDYLMPSSASLYHPDYTVSNGGLTLTKTHSGAVNDPQASLLNGYLDKTTLTGKYYKEFIMTSDPINAMGFPVVIRNDAPDFSVSTGGVVGSLQDIQNSSFYQNTVTGDRFGIMIDFDTAEVTYYNNTSPNGILSGTFDVGNWSSATRVYFIAGAGNFNFQVDIPATFNFTPAGATELK